MSKEFDEKFYQYLNIHASATDEEIKKAWRKRARELHEDMVGNDSRNEEFSNAKLAVKVLGDPKSRAEYDEWLAQQRAVRDRPDEDDPEPEFSPPSPPKPPSPPPPTAATQHPKAQSSYAPQPADPRNGSYVVWSLLAASVLIAGIVYWVWPSTPPKNLPYTRIQQQHRQNIVDVAFSPDGTEVASASEDGTVIVSEPNGENQTTIASPGTDSDGLLTEPTSVAFSADGNFLAIGYTNGGVEIFDSKNLNSGYQSAIDMPSVNVEGLAFGTEDANDILAVGFDSQSSGALNLYNVSDANKEILSIDHPVSRIAFSPSGMFIADAGDGVVEVRNSSDGSLVFSTPDSTALSLAFSSDSEVLAIADPTAVQLWNSSQNAISKSISHSQFDHENTAGGQFVAYSQDGMYLAYVSGPPNDQYSAEVEIFSASNYNQISSFPNGSYIYAIAFSSRGLLATGGGPGNGAPGFGDNSAHIWSLYDLQSS